MINLAGGRNSLPTRIVEAPVAATALVDMMYDLNETG